MRRLHNALTRILCAIGSIFIIAAALCGLGVMDIRDYREYGRVPFGKQLDVEGISYLGIHLREGRRIAVDGVFVGQWSDCEAYLLRADASRVVYQVTDDGRVFVFVSRPPPVTRTSERIPIRLPIVAVIRTWETFPLCSGHLLSERERMP